MSISSALASPEPRDYRGAFVYTVKHLRAGSCPQVLSVCAYLSVGFFLYFFDDFGGVSRRDGIGGDVVRDDASRADDGVFSHGHAGEDDGARSDPYAALNMNGF